MFARTALENSRFPIVLITGGDKIRLFKSGSDQAADEVTYFSQDIPAHAQGQSTGRNPDGIGYWTIFTSPSPNDDTSCDTPTPNPTPAPTLSSSTASKSPTSSPTPIKSPTPTPKASQKASSTLQPSPQVLGETQNQINSSPLPSSSPNAQSQTANSKTKVAAILTGSGAILIGLSLVAYLWYRKSQISQNANFKEEEKDGSKI